MKNLYCGLQDCLRCWPVFRGACLFALCLSVSELLILALWHQFTGRFPSTKTLNLMLWNWELPFAVSRLWDMALLPAFVFLSYKNEEYRENKYFERYGIDPYYGDSVVDFKQIALAIALICGCTFGVIYFLPALLIVVLLIMLIGLIAW